MRVIGRCHQLADRLDAHPPIEIAEITSDIRRLASILAGGILDHAHYLDHDDTPHRHHKPDDEDD